MLIAAAAATLIAIVGLSGRSISRLGDLTLHHVWLVVVALVVQTLLVSGPSIGPEGASSALHIGSYGLLALFVWRNRSVSWLWVVAVGGACNALVITANAGVMPASRAALAAAGLAGDAGYVNSGLLDAPRLALLGDVFSTPRWMPLANVFSIGDVVIVVGLGLVVVAATGRARVGGGRMMRSA